MIRFINEYWINVYSDGFGNAWSTKADALANADTSAPWARPLLYRIHVGLK